MPWRLIFSPRAEKNLTSLPRRDREAVRRALDQLMVDFGSEDVKKLSGRPNEWRLRVGRWRVILELDNQTGLINVTRVLPRGRAYRD